MEEPEEVSSAEKRRGSNGVEIGKGLLCSGRQNRRLRRVVTNLTRIELSGFGFTRLGYDASLQIRMKLVISGTVQVGEKSLGSLSSTLREA